MRLREGGYRKGDRKREGGRKERKRKEGRKDRKRMGDEGGDTGSGEREGQREGMREVGKTFIISSRYKHSKPFLLAFWTVQYITVIYSHPTVQYHTRTSCSCLIVPIYQPFLVPPTLLLSPAFGILHSTLNLYEISVVRFYI
jgi:hypothetical protein